MIHQGSRVKYVGDDPRWKGKTGVVLRVMDYSEDGRENYYWIDFPGRPSLPESELVAANSRACNSTNPVVANAMRASGVVARNADLSVSQIIAKWNDATRELEAMVKKATPWRTEMKRMRARADGELSGLWYSIPKDDPDAQKAQDAYSRYMKARSDASDLWFSI